MSDGLLIIKMMIDIIHIINGMISLPLTYLVFIEDFKEEHSEEVGSGVAA